MNRKEQLSQLIEKYDKNKEQYLLDSYNETEVRSDFINIFFELLGWDVNNNANLPLYLREVKQEANVIVEDTGKRKNKKPDYLFKIGTENKFYVEAKKPHVDILNNKEAVFQTRRYGWSGNLKISILTNFNDILIYDTSIRPLQEDDTNVALIAKYNYSEYEEKFEEIYKMLSKESVLDGSFDEKFSNINLAYRKEKFDDYFLTQIKKWRNLLAEDIVKQNEKVSQEYLNIYIQKILNRILFLRICEDRNIEEYETIKNIQNYNQLEQIFKKADQKYDSGLFELLEENINISDSTLIDIFKDLYYPNSSYDFSVVDSFLIGQIYEIFLEEEIIIENGKVSIKPKLEIEDSQGIVTTPKYIADNIIRESFEAKLKIKDIDQLENIRIADICCGSGIFLISAYELLIQYYIEALVKEGLENNIIKGNIIVSSNNVLKLSYEMKRNILKKNIFGVDIDYLAVEVCKFGLLLKLIEDESSEELEQFQIFSHEKILPNIDENIKIGNSLVDYSFCNFKPEIKNDINLLKKVKIFDWNTEFFNRFNGEKFDIIVGNPPYIRVQKLAKYIEEEYSYYKSEYANYKTINAVAPDKYYLFIEKAIKLIKDDGIIGYITPHKFMINKSGEKLRYVLSEGKYIKKIIHFRANQVFNGKLTYCCILILEKNSVNFEIKFVEELVKYKYNEYIEGKIYSSNILTNEPWICIPTEVSSKLEKFKSKTKILSEFVNIFVGIQTSNDKIYMIEPKNEDEEYVYFQDKNNISRKIEKGILKKGINDVVINKYNKIEFNRYIIFPYKFVDGKAILYNLEELKEKFGFAYKYFNEYKDELEKRSIQNKNDNNWFQFGRNQSLNKFQGKEHLIWPVLSKNGNYVYDNETIMFSGGGNGPYYGLEMKENIEESIFYIQALLNHRLLEDILECKSSIFNDNYYSHGKQFIEDLPIRKIDFSNPEEKKYHDDIVENVKRLMELFKKLKSVKNNEEKILLKRVIKIEEDNLNNIIDMLYQI